MRLNYLVAYLIAILALLPARSLCQANHAGTKAPASDSERINLLTDLQSPINCTDGENQLSKTMEAKVLAKKANWTNGIIQANRKCADILFACLGNYSAALKYYEDNATIAAAAEDNKGHAFALESSAKCYEKQGRHKQALECFAKAIGLNPGVDIETGIWADMGLTYNTIGDYTNALAAYVTSLELLDKSVAIRKKGDIQDTLQRTGLLMNIGDIYQSMSQPDKALENYTNALKISQKINDRHLQICSGIGIGFTWKIKKDYNRALAVYTDALSLCNAADYRDKCSILTEMANVYLDARQTDAAMEKATAAIQIATVHEFADMQPRCYAVLGKIYLAQNKYPQAAMQLEKALDIYHVKGELDDEKDTWEALSTVYGQMGQPQKSLTAYKHFISIRDSIYNIKKANELTRIDLEFRYSRKQLADSLKQAGIFAKKIQRQRFVTYGGYTALVMVLLLMFFIYRNYIIQRKYNLLLSKEKRTHLAHIKAQNTVLTDIAHIQSHKVRGPVATILGLAQLFNHEDPSDPVNKEVIEGIAVTTEELDKVVKEVIIKENTRSRPKK